MITIAHVITALSIGGAERMLQKLLERMDRHAFTPRVYTLLSPAGTIGDRIRALGIPVRELGMSRGVPNPTHVVRLARWLRHDAPDLVQTWMYHADLVGGLAARAAGMPLVWNIRNSTLDGVTSRPRTHRVVKACARLSAWLPDEIVCCSHAACDVHTAAGYRRSKITVIPNGFDLAAFRPNPMARRAVRSELSIPGSAQLIGLVARFDPQKDFQTFFEAAAYLHALMPHVHFLMCGRGLDWSNAALAALVDASGTRAVTHLIGERADVAPVIAALDIATSSSSYGEAFPNAIGEAMACGVPCVVTDVGDSGRIVGETGYVVPRRNPRALCDAWFELLELDVHAREALGRDARDRVAARFSIDSVARTYEETYRRVLAARAQRPARARRAALF